MSTKSQYKKLIKEALYHDQLYFIKAKPEISDFEYDQLIKSIEAIEKEHPDWLDKESPSQRVTGDFAIKSKFKQVEHTHPMLSLSNTYTEDELEDFLKRMHKHLEKSETDFTIELKIDGVAISVRYEKGVLCQGVTRGDGKKGEDVTENIKTIKSLPQVLKGKDIPDVLELRGEVYLPLETFKKLNKEKEEEGEDVYANPRNAAAGSLKLLDANETKRRGLDIFIYDIAQGPESITKQSQVSNYLEKLGFPVFPTDLFKVCHTTKQILDFAHAMEERRRRLSFEIDGIVVKLDDLKSRAHIGMTGKSPRWAVAYKFAPEQEITVIEDITVQVGRTGVLTPVAELKPVKLAGSTISRATLHNQDEIDRKDIRVGDHVVIEKGGDVIPKVVSVDLSKRRDGAEKWKMPTTCPSCGSSVVHEAAQVAVRCVNPDCKSQNLRKIIFFAAKDAMDIDNMGEKIVEKLALAGYVTNFSDIYRLSEFELSQVEGFKEKSVENLLQSIEASKDTTLDRLIFGLGIKFVGKQTAEIIAEYVGGIEGFIHITHDELIGIEGIGPIVAESVVSFLKNPSNIEEINQLLELGVKPKGPKKKNNLHLFNGKTFVLTGSLEKYTRSEAASLIKERGGKVTSSVSSSTDFVLAGESPGSKYDKAKKLGVKILSEVEFEKKLEEND